MMCGKIYHLILKDSIKYMKTMAQMKSINDAPIHELTDKKLVNIISYVIKLYKDGNVKLDTQQDIEAFIKSRNNFNSDSDTIEIKRSSISSSSSYNDSYPENTASIKAQVDQIVSSYQELSSLQEDDIQQLNNQKTLLYNKVFELNQIIDKYEDIIRKNEEKNAAFDEQNRIYEDTINSYENQIQQLNDKNNEIRKYITNILSEFTNEIPDDKEINEFVMNSFQLLVDHLNQDYVSKSKYEVIIEQLEELIKLLSGIANKEEEKNKKMFLLAQCARIGHYIDEQLNESGIGELTVGENVFYGFDSETLINTFFDNISDEEIEKSPFREIIALFNGVLIINKMLLNNNQELLSDKDSMSSCLISLQNQVKSQDQWKQNQLHNISLIEDALGDVNCPPEDSIPNLISAYKDLMKENQQLIEQCHDDNHSYDRASLTCIKDKFVALEHDFATEKVKFKNTVDELSRKIQDKDKTINELNNKIIKSKKNKKAKIEKFQNELNELKNQLKEIENEYLITKNKNTSLSEQKVISDDKIKNLSTKIEEHQKEFQQYQNEKSEQEKKIKHVLKNYHSQFIEYEQNQKRINDYIYKCKLVNKKLKEKLFNVIKENEDLKKENNTLFSNISELNVTESSLRAQLLLIQKREENNTAIKTDNQNLKQTNENLYKKIKKIVSFLEDILTNTFNYKTQIFHLADTSDQLIDILLNKINEKSKEAISQYKELNQKVNELNQTVQQTKNENEKLKTERDSSFSPTSKCRRGIRIEPSDSSELKSWESWARSLCHRICGNLVTRPYDMKFIIEEAMMSNIGYKEVYQKLEFLRREKKFFTYLLKENCPDYQKESKRTLIISIRPIVAFLVFTGRIKKMAGNNRIETIISKSLKHNSPVKQTINSPSSMLSFISP